MNTAAFEKTSWSWQFNLFQQQVQEWLEYQFSRFENTLPELPSGSISPWVVELLKILFWVTLVLFSAWLVWRLWQVFNPHLYSWVAKFDKSRISQLDSKSRELSIKFLLGKGQEFYQQGNYREACRYLYLAMLQQLHEQAVLAQEPSRTDGEYLQFLTATVTPMQPYETLITTHEQLCFSEHEILAENYQRCDQAYQQLFN